MRTDEDRIANLFTVRAKNSSRRRTGAGDIGVVTKLEDVSLANTLIAGARPDLPCRNTRSRCIVAVSPAHEGGQRQDGPSVASLTEEDPTLRRICARHQAERAARHG